jgi:hypothetical protein
VASAGISDHAVMFYRGSELAELVGEHLLGAISRGGTAVIVAAPDQRVLVDAWLARAGVDLHATVVNRSYVALDAEDTMRGFMLNGWPDPAAFWRTMSPVLMSSSNREGPVKVYGEMVALLWAAGLVNAAIDVEAMWNELATHYSFSLLCGYPAAARSDAAHADALEQVCAAHSAVLPARS